ncbi:MAG: SRPBCC domain-containing protein [Candidatus Electryoneaceae bacterium]|nr:SRPBCC domain-containing protein [Candidatus Electryoneaceae bacterium]
MGWRYHGRTLIAVRPEEIFPYISTSDGFTKWFIRRCEPIPDTGGRFLMHWSGEEKAEGIVLESVQDERFSFEWTHDSLSLTTRIDMWLESVEGGVMFHIEEKEFPEELKYVDTLNSITEGWTIFLYNLKSVILSGYDLRDEWD